LESWLQARALIWLSDMSSLVRVESSRISGMIVTCDEVQGMKTEFGEEWWG
jgi:hypothetical protein